MAWYKTGTVTVTNGQTSVTGTGTKFATNARVGDGFTGPDGKWYEVTNIASETVIAIYPAYAGATISNSAAYTIAPIQGYNKETADRLRAITDSLTIVTSVAGKTGAVTLNKGDVGLGSVDNTADISKPVSTATQNALNGKKDNFTVLPVSQGGTGGTTQATARSGIAAAGSGANSDITSLGGLTTALTVSQGGTGGTTQATARSGLGLGSAAVATLGTNSGNAMPVGAFGLGSQASAFVNIDALTTTEFRSIVNPAGTQPGFPYGTSLTISYNNDTFSQLAMSVLGNELAYRYYNSTTVGFSPWVKIYHTGNTTRGSGGALSAASPIVRIANVSETERRDLQEQTFEPAGDWGVANNEAKGVHVERLTTGEYRISGSLGLAVEGWRTQDPCSPDGGRTLGVTMSQQESDGTVVIKLFKQRWTLSDEGEMIPGLGAPMDVPLNSWIDVRLEMPEVIYNESEIQSED